MENKQVVVVTNPEFGWDCVVGVYDLSKITLEELETHYDLDIYVFTVRVIESKIEEEN